MKVIISQYKSQFSPAVRVRCGAFQFGLPCSPCRALQPCLPPPGSPEERQQRGPALQPHGYCQRNLGVNVHGVVGCMCLQRGCSVPASFCCVLSTVAGAGHMPTPGAHTLSAPLRSGQATPANKSIFQRPCVGMSRRRGVVLCDYLNLQRQ